MIPSRGVLMSSRAIGIGKRRLETVSTRSFSASTGLNGSVRSTPHSFRAGTLTSRVSTRPGIQSTGYILRNASAIRFKSTVVPLPGIPPSTTEALSPEALSSASSNLPSWASTSSGLNLDTTPDLSNINILDIPERIGYLKELGLDYGFGPTAMMEFFLEHIHVYSGMPWWGSIITTALVVRIVFFKLFLNASDNAARMATIAHLTKPLLEKQQAAMAKGDTATVMKYRTETSVIHNRAGVKLWKSFAPMISVVTGYGTFVLLRAMANLPVPGLEDGGVLWFHNLAIADPYFILPIVTSAVLHIAIKSGGETGANTMSETAIRALSVGLPGISLIFTSFMPAGLQLSFLFTGVFTYLQGQLFRFPAFRRFAKLTPLPTLRSGTSMPADATPGSGPTVQSRVVTMKPNSEGRWEAPNPTSSVSSSSSTATSSKAKSNSMFSALSKGVEETVTAVKSSHKATVKKASEMMGNSPQAGATMSKKEKAAVNKLEGQRRVEESQRRARFDREKLERRRAKKMGGGE